MASTSVRLRIKWGPCKRRRHFCKKLQELLQNDNSWTMPSFVGIPLGHMPSIEHRNLYFLGGKPLRWLVFWYNDGIDALNVGTSIYGHTRNCARSGGMCIIFVILCLFSTDVRAVILRGIWTPVNQAFQVLKNNLLLPGNVQGRIWKAYGETYERMGLSCRSPRASSCWAESAPRVWIRRSPKGCWLHLKKVAWIVPSRSKQSWHPCCITYINLNNNKILQMAFLLICTHRKYTKLQANSTEELKADSAK